MKCLTTFIVLLALASCACAQGVGAPQIHEVSPTELQAVLDLPLGDAVARREVFKKPLKAAYIRQIAKVDHDCDAESQAGQQPYNVCMGGATLQADADFAIFYNSLQMLCHDQKELQTLHDLQRARTAFNDNGMRAAQAAWSDGSGAPGFHAQVYLSLIRMQMRLMHEIYGLNIAQ